ncbi:ABC transporter permease [Longirhabdus pacifica]|uniref:ABC transporter permease n=1 Tax=Longirhabdus pacifica TaxID=2305227 RepID=UPI0010090D42|nr:ABC transporter permease [Longirhabdus pacifica]
MFVTIFLLLNKGIFRDIYAIIWSALLPVGLLVGLGLYTNESYFPQLLTGVLTLNVLFGAFNTSCIQMIQQRNQGVYKLIHVTPTSSLYFITILTLVRSFFTFVLTLLTLAVSILFFEWSISIFHFLILIVVLTLGNICFTALSIVTANFARHEGQGNMLTNLIAFPMLFTSEAFYSMDAAPSWLQYVAKCMPFSYLVDAVHHVIQGNNLDVSLVYALIITAFSLLFMMFASLTFNWNPGQQKLN